MDSFLDSCQIVKNMLQESSGPLQENSGALYNWFDIRFLLEDEANAQEDQFPKHLLRILNSK